MLAASTACVCAIAGVHVAGATATDFVLQSAVDPDPLPGEGCVVHSGCARFTLLSAALVRMEKARAATPATFDDRATFAVVNRRLPRPAFHVDRNATTRTTTITTDSFVLTHRTDDCDKQSQFSARELTVRMRGKPGGEWRAGGYGGSARQGSSVATIEREARNLNGTMNYGPSFAGGLDCYSNPPDCNQRYRQVIGAGLVSRAGYAVVNDSNSTRLAAAPSSGEQQWFEPSSTREAHHRVAEDLYLLVSGLNYTRALRDWASVGGAPSLPPLSALGVWYSRYFPYGEQTYEHDIVAEYEANGLPLSVGVLDVPWHNIDYAIADLGPDKNGSWPYPDVPGTANPDAECNGWDGFTFNKTLFPDPKRFFDHVHARGIKMILSVHMQNGIDHCQEQYPAMARAMGLSEHAIRANKTVACVMDNRTYVDAFFKTIVDAEPVRGTADWWWLDYPGGASGISGWSQQEPASVWWSNHIFAEHARAANKRPVILARYGGLGAQRDGLGFSGDTFQSYSTLQFQAEMTPTASNVLFGWWSHDIGGNHNGGTSSYNSHGAPVGPYPGDENPKNATGSEMLLRWIQFGTFSPIFRTHCEPSCDRYVWTFPHFAAMRAAMVLRDALVPYIYTAGVAALRTGVSLLRPMYYAWPEEELAYAPAHRGQYMFGDQGILVAPVVEPSDESGTARKVVWLPPGPWLTWAGESLTAAGATNHTHTAEHGSATRLGDARWSKYEIPLFVAPGTVIPMRTMASTYSVFADPVVWVAWSNSKHKADGRGLLYEDEGDGLSYIHGARAHSEVSAHTAATLHWGSTGSTIVLSIGAASGTYAGQRASRHHRIQFRGQGLGGEMPTQVLVNGSPVARLPSGNTTNVAGWYIAAASPDGRANFTEPAGVLVVCTFKVSTFNITTVEVSL